MKDLYRYRHLLSQVSRHPESESAKVSIFYHFFMYLSDRDIRSSLHDRNITITDFDDERLQPASYDIRLGSKFLIVKDYSVNAIDPMNKILPEYEEIIVTPEEGFILRP